MINADIFKYKTLIARFMDVKDAKLEYIIKDDDRDSFLENAAKLKAAIDAFPVQITTGNADKGVTPVIYVFGARKNNIIMRPSGCDIRYIHFKDDTHYFSEGDTYLLKKDQDKSFSYEGIDYFIQNTRLYGR